MTSVWTFYYAYITRIAASKTVQDRLLRTSRSSPQSAKYFTWRRRDRTSLSQTVSDTLVPQRPLREKHCRTQSSSAQARSVSTRAENEGEAIQICVRTEAFLPSELPSVSFWVDGSLVLRGLVPFRLPAISFVRAC